MDVQAFVSDLIDQRVADTEREPSTGVFAGRAEIERVVSALIGAGALTAAEGNQLLGQLDERLLRRGWSVEPRVTAVPVVAEWSVSSLDESNIVARSDGRRHARSSDGAGLLLRTVRRLDHVPVLKAAGIQLTSLEVWRNLTVLRWAVKQGSQVNELMGRRTSLRWSLTDETGAGYEAAVALTGVTDGLVFAETAFHPPLPVSRQLLTIRVTDGGAADCVEVALDDDCSPGGAGRAVMDDV